MSHQIDLFGSTRTSTSKGKFDQIGNAKAKDELHKMDLDLSKLERMKERAEATLAAMGRHRTVLDRERAEFKIQYLADEIAKQKRAIAELRRELMEGAWS